VNPTYWMPRFLMAAAVTLAVLAVPARARACSCVEPGDVASSLDAAGSVFEGKVLSLRHRPAAHRITVRIEVLQHWKGESGKTIDVVTVDQGSMCGFEFQRGTRYLIFAQEKVSPLSVSICSRTKASSAAAEDIAELNRLAKAGPGAVANVDGAAPTPVKDAASAPPSQAPESAPLPTSAGAPAPATTPAKPAQPAPTRGSGGSCAGCSVPRGEAGSALPLALIALLLALRARGGAKPSRRQRRSPAR